MGVDLGGTNISAAVFDDGMKILGRSERPTRAQEGADEVIRRMAACVREALERASVAAGEVAGVGVGAAGLTDWRTGVVVLASNLGWRNVPLKERLEQELDGLRVEVDKDTNAAALAEARLGAGREFEHFLYVTAGTGIGGGLILDGALYRGATGGAGDIGHVVVDPDGPRVRLRRPRLRGGLLLRSRDGRPRERGCSLGVEGSGIFCPGRRRG